VISCLRGAGVEVVERHEPVWEGTRDAWRAGPTTALRLARAELRLLRRAPEHYDAVIVGYPGHFDLPAARRTARGAPVVFNPLVSLADTLVSDRERFRAGSLPARALALADRFALRAAEVVVADTEQHARFLARLAGLDRVEVCFVGAEERVFWPGERNDTFTHALFVGKLIPLQGVETILEAARLAPDVAFRVVGSGQLGGLLERRADNVEWVPWVEYEQLADELHRAGAALGIFGRSDKAARVIPNKAFQALACGTPLITADTPAVRELLVDGESALLVPPGDAPALASALRRLASDDALRARIGEGGLAAYRRQASEEVLGRRWRAILERAK
jgi:glycosyltransferase involved in cell wall biosynthesis